MKEENQDKKCENCAFFDKSNNYCKSIKVKFNENTKIKRCDGFEDNRIQQLWEHYFNAQYDLDIKVPSFIQYTGTGENNYRWVTCDSLYNSPYINNVTFSDDNENSYI